MLAHAFLTGMGAEEGSNPGGLVVSGSLPKEPSPAVQLLPSGLGEPIAVIQGSMWTLFCRNYRRCSLLARSAYEGIHLFRESALP